MNAMRTGDKMRAYADIYGDEEYLRSYIQSGSSYYETAQQYLEAGTEHSEVLRMMIDAANAETAFQFVGPAKPPQQAAPAQFPGAALTELTPEEQQEFDIMLAEIQTRVEELMSEGEAQERESVDERALRELREREPRTGLFGTIKDMLDKYALDGYVEKEMAPRGTYETYKEYQRAMDIVGEKAVTPAVTWTKKQFFKAQHLDAQQIEADIHDSVIGGGPGRLDLDRYTQLYDHSKQGILPPVEEYSEEFRNKLLHPDKYPKYTAYWFLTTDEASRVRTRGEIDMSTIIPPRVYAEHPLLSSVAYVGLGTGGELLERFILDPLEDTRNWHWYLAADVAGYLVMGPGVKMLSGYQGTGKLGTIGQKLVTKRWEMGRSFKKFLGHLYTKPGARAILAKKRPVPMSTLQSYFRDAGMTDEFLTKNPFVVDVYDDILSRDPKLMQKMLDTLNDAITKGTLDDLVYDLRLPRGPAVKDLTAVAPGKIALRDPSSGVLDMIAMNENERAAATVQWLWNKGIDTSSTSLADDGIRIVLQNPSDDVLAALSSRKSPFALSRISEARISPGDVVRTTAIDPEDLVTIHIPEGRVAQGIKFLSDLDEFAAPIQVQKSPKQWFMDLEDAVDAGWLTSQQLDDLSKTIILPEEVTAIETVRPALVAGGPAAPTVGDIGVAPPPAEGRPVTPESQVAPQYTPPIAARSVTGKRPWDMTPEEWMLSRRMPADIDDVHRHIAAIKNWDEVPDRHIEAYLKKLESVVKKYTPGRAQEFDKAMVQFYNKASRSYKTRGSFEKFKMFAHVEADKIVWADAMLATGKKDPREAILAIHERIVREAAEAGVDIADNVLRHYPDVARIKGVPMTMDELERTMVPPPPPRDIPPGPLSTEGVIYKNSEALRKLGWSDAQIKQMSTYEATRAIGQNLTSHNYKLRGDKILSVAQPDIPPVSVDDLVPKPLASKLISELSDDNVLALSSAYSDPRFTPEEVLQTLSDNIPAVAATLKAAGKPKDPAALIDEMLRVWNVEKLTPASMDDVMKGARDEQFRNLAQKFKDRMIKTYSQLRKDGKAPAFTDPELKVHFAAGQSAEDAWLKKVWQSEMHKAKSHWNRSFHPEATSRLFMLDRKLRKLYPQFWDDYRTGVIPAPQEALAYADRTMGYIFADLNKYERQHVLNILGLRNYIANLSDELTIPGAWNMDVLMNNLDIQMKGATPRITGSVDRFNYVMNVTGQKLVDDGVMNPASLRSNYFPEYVLNYAPGGLIDNKVSVGLRSQLKSPYRRYTKRRYGSPQEISLSEGAIKYRLAQGYLDDSTTDWGLMQLTKHDLWDTVVKPGMTAEETFLARSQVFGVDDATGKLRQPRPNQRIPIEGSEDYIGYQFVPGSAYYTTDSISSGTAFGNFIEDLLLIDPTDAERFASQLDLQDIAKGIFPKWLDDMIADAGPQGGALTRRVRAIGRRNKVYMIPETIHKRLTAFNNQTISNIPGLLSVMKFTSKWKQLTLDWAGLPFHMGNIMGDSYNMFRTSGWGPVAEMRGASRTLANLHRPVGRELKLGGLFGQMTEDDRFLLQGALDKQVLSSGFSAELATTHPITNPTHYYQMIQRASGYREALCRLSMFRYQVKQFRKYGKWNAPGFNRFLYDKAGEPKLDMLSGAGLIGRRFTVDYEALPAYYNQIFRGSTFPFMTFWDQNARNWGWFVVEGKSKVLTRVVLPRVAAHAYNNTVWPETERSLGGLAKRGHLNLWEWDADGDGINDYGLVWAPQLPVDMALQVIGLDTMEQRIVRYFNGFYGKDPEAGAKQMVKEQLRDMSTAVPRLANKLSNPLIQATLGIMRNRHPITGKPILTENQKKLGYWRQSKEWRKLYLSSVITPFGQFMMDKNNHNYDTLDALGINPRQPMRALLKGPLNIIRGMGIFVVDLKKDEQDATQFSKMDAVRVEAGIKQDLYNKYAQWEGAASDFDSFLVQPEVLQIISDGVALGLNYNRQQIVSWLTGSEAQEQFWGERVNQATGAQRIEALKNYKLAVAINKQKAMKATPTTVRPLMYEKIGEMEAFKD